MEAKLKKSFALNLQKTRNDKRLTQAEVAEGANLSVNHYAKIERGEVFPGIDTLARITKSLDAHSSDILPF